MCGVCCADIKEEDLQYRPDADKLGQGNDGIVYRVRYNGADVAAKFWHTG